MKKSDIPWAKELEFDEEVSKIALTLLEDTRNFTPEEIGIDWLFRLVQSSDPEYHEFAKKYMIKALLPADFVKIGGILGIGSSETDAVNAGCDILWQILTDKEKDDKPLNWFTAEYFRWHHPGIHKKLDDIPLSKIAEIPEEFLTFERFKPLLLSEKSHLRNFALEFAYWEFARWNPLLESLLEFIESGYTEIVDFISKALLSEDIKENENYHMH